MGTQKQHLTDNRQSGSRSPSDRRRRPVLLSAALASAIGLTSACGGEDIANEPLLLPPDVEVEQSQTRTAASIHKDHDPTRRCFGNLRLAYNNNHELVVLGLLPETWVYAFNAKLGVQSSRPWYNRDWRRDRYRDHIRGVTRIDSPALINTGRWTVRASHFCDGQMQRAVLYLKCTDRCRRGR